MFADTWNNHCPPPRLPRSAHARPQAPSLHWPCLRLGVAHTRGGLCAHLQLLRLLLELGRLLHHRPLEHLPGAGRSQAREGECAEHGLVEGDALCQWHSATADDVALMTCTADHPGTPNGGYHSGASCANAV